MKPFRFYFCRNFDDLTGIGFRVFVHHKVDEYWDQVGPKHFHLEVTILNMSIGFRIGRSYWWQ